MVERKWLIVTIGALVFGGCTPVATVPPASPTAAERTPTTPANTETVPPAISTEAVPPAVETSTTPTPAQQARADLADRLKVDAELVKVVDAVERAPDPNEMPCLSEGSATGELLAQADQVMWITLSVKGNTYHYLAWGDVVVSCDGP